jgi:hypothetical protein
MMYWTKSPPTKPGFYWCKLWTYYSKPRVVEVYAVPSGALRIKTGPISGAYVKNYKGLWGSEEIPLPLETKESKNYGIKKSI